MPGVTITDMNLDISSLFNELDETGYATTSELCLKSGLTRYAVKNALHKLFEQKLIMVSKKRVTGMDGVARLHPCYKLIDTENINLLFDTVKGIVVTKKKPVLTSPQEIADNLKKIGPYNPTEAEASG